MAPTSLLLLLLSFLSAVSGQINKEESLESFSQAPSSETTATVLCDTSVGKLTIDVKGHWLVITFLSFFFKLHDYFKSLTNIDRAPLGSKRFIEMVDAHWFNNLYMPRVRTICLKE
jgi:flagellar biogenesis protein FliO